MTKITFATFRLVCTCLFLFVCSSAFSQSEDSALGMVKALRLGENLAQMNYVASKTTQTYRNMEQLVGGQQAEAVLKAELAVSISKHQDQWNRNLAQVWGALMTREELDSLASQRQQSPFAKKFMSLQSQAGTAMKVKSEPLLIATMTEALTRAFDRASRKSDH